MWDVKGPTHYSKRVGHEVHGLLAVVCEWVSEGDVPRMGLTFPFVYYHLALLCKSCRKKSYLKIPGCEVNSVFIRAQQPPQLSESNTIP